MCKKEKCDIVTLIFTAAVLSDFWQGLSNVLPSPQDFGQGLGDGIASFFQTLPQIGNSFQSLFNFNEFPLPSLPQGMIWLENYIDIGWKFYNIYVHYFER